MSASWLVLPLAVVGIAACVLGLWIVFGPDVSADSDDGDEDV